MTPEIDYDGWLSDAKKKAIDALLCLSSGQGVVTKVEGDMGHALDELNKAWDAMTAAIIRQRQERDRQIIRLIDELAEARKK